MKKSSAAKQIDPRDLIRMMEDQYNVVLPQRYKQFLLKDEYKKYKKIKFTGTKQDSFHLNFVVPELADPYDLGQKSGILDIGNDIWEESYSSYIPVAYLFDPKDKGDPSMDQESGSKCFLVIDLEDKSKSTPVFLFDYDGWYFYLIASSFNEFLKNLPKAKINGSFDPQSGETAKSQAELKKEEEKKHKDSLGSLGQQPYKKLWDSSLTKALKGDLEASLKDLFKIHTSLPENHDVLRALAKIYRRKKDLKTALTYIDKSLELDSTDPKSVNLKCDVLIQAHGLNFKRKSGFKFELEDKKHIGNLLSDLKGILTKAKKKDEASEVANLIESLASEKKRN